jgi:hypothetical protein
VRRLIQYGFYFLIGLPGKLIAQHVIYSETIHASPGLRIRVIGKTENYYWTARLQKQKNDHSQRTETTELLGFDLFDARLNLIRQNDPYSIAGTAKQWLMTGKNEMDQVILTISPKKTRLICGRLNTEGEKQIRVLDSFPFPADPSAVLMVRSEDRSKILFIAFENTEELITRLHAVLFDENWNTLYHRVISDSLFSQPCIQDDEIGSPGESFDNLPIKLANDGEWLMAGPSRVSRHFTLFHSCANGIDHQFREITVSPFYKVEDMAMSIDNEKQEMSVGLLSRYLKTSLKNVRITNYSISQGRFDFDTSYRFNTQHQNPGNKNLSHESFVSVPGGGFMLMKEYGISIESEKPELPFVENWEAVYLLANYNETNESTSSLAEGYTLKGGLQPIPFIRNRGDLNVFYFPAVTKDSLWSGSLVMEQHAESNNPDLSYLMIPEKNKLHIIYNSLEGSEEPLATTTTLNKQGQPTGSDALIFWKMNKILNFQQARRFAVNEVAIPYKNNRQNGFAIIRLN